MVEKSVFQKFEGEDIHLVRITNTHGEFVEILDYGATIYSLNVRDKLGELRDIVLGYESIEKYAAADTCFGGTVGRVANRISGAKFELNGETYELFDNTGKGVTLHGGEFGWHKKFWDIGNMTDDSVTLNYFSGGGDENFPGDVSFKLTFTFTDDAELKLSYFAISDEDTPLNITNHSYFNLDGHAAPHDILKTVLMINSDTITPLGEDFTPNGELEKVDDTPFDFRKPTAIGLRIADDNPQLQLADGYDINYVIPGEGMRLFAKALSLESGITLACYSNMPCVQFYTGNFIQQRTPSKGNLRYDKRQGFCLETQNYPDALNKPFPSYVIKKFMQYSTETIYKFGTIK